MLEIGKSYKTKTGKTVQIISENDKPMASCEVFEGIIEVGPGVKHWTMYSKDGKCYESASLDIKLDQEPRSLNEAMDMFVKRSGITIEMKDSFYEGLVLGFKLAQKP